MYEGRMSVREKKICLTLNRRLALKIYICLINFDFAYNFKNIKKAIYFEYIFV